MKVVVGLALLSALLFVACSGGSAEDDIPAVTATETRSSTATPKPISAPRAREQCWDVWDAINAQNKGAPAEDWQIATAISACRSTFSWNHVLSSDFIEPNLERPPTDEEIIRVCLVDATISQRISMWSICTSRVEG